MTFVEPLSVADRFALALEGLRRLVASRIAGGMMAAAMIVLVWQRLQRIEGRIGRMLARFRAGRLVVRGEVAGRVAGVRTGGGSAGLPRGFAWLVQLIPHQAANFAGQIGAVLAEPEMVALLAAAPQARRVLAPLCRMLGIAPEVLRPEAVEAVAALTVSDAGRVGEDGVASQPLASPCEIVPCVSDRLRR